MADGTFFHFAEHLILLNVHGEGLLTGLHNLKRVLAQCDPHHKSSSGGPTADATLSTREAVGSETTYRLFTDPSIAGVLKYFIKKFPEQADVAKATGFDAFTRQQREILIELQSAYQLLVGFQEFHDCCIALFQQAEKSEALTMSTVHDLCLEYIRLNATFVACHLVFNQMVQERKGIAAAYSKAYSAVNGVSEPNFRRLVSFMTTHERPFQIVQEEQHIMPVAKLSTALVSARALLEQGPLSPADGLRKIAVLSLINTTTGTLKSGYSHIESRWLRALENTDVYLNCIAFGLVAGPSELLKHAPAQDVVKSTMPHVTLSSYMRYEALSITAEYEAAFKSSSKYKRLGSLLSDVASAAPLSVNFHRERRELLRHQLRQTLELCIHNPQILASLFAIVCASLSLAVHEITWYFEQVDRSAAPGKKGSTGRKVADGTITEMMWLTDRIRKMALDRKQAIQRYYFQELTLHAGSQLKPLLFSLRDCTPPVSEAVLQVLEATIDLIESTSSSGYPDQPDAPVPSFEGVRVNYMRIQVCLTLPHVEIQPDKAEILLATMEDMAMLTRYVDIFDDYIDRVGSLKNLYVHRYSLTEHLIDVLDNSAEQSRYCDVYTALACEFPKRASQFWPTELEWLGQQSALYGQQTLQLIGKKAADLMLDIVHTMVIFGKQLTPDYLADVLADTHFQRKHAPPKKSQGPTALAPAWESTMAPLNEPGISTLKDKCGKLRNLLWTISSTPILKVHDRVFSPPDFFADAFADCTKKWLSGNAFLESDGNSFKEPATHLPDEQLLFHLKRPSHYLSDLRSIMTAVQLFNSWAGDLDLFAILGDLIRDQFDAVSCRKIYESQQLDQVILRPAKGAKGRKADINYKPQPVQPALMTYTIWYLDLIANKSTTGGICLSPAKKALISRSMMTFRAEDYTDVQELSALCQFIGAEGARFIDERILKLAVVMAAGIKDAIVENSQVLSSLQQSWKYAQLADEDLGKLQKLDDVVGKATTMGVAVEFRKLLHNALRIELRLRAPFLTATLGQFVRPSTRFENDAEQQAADELAFRAGLAGSRNHVDRESVNLLCNNVFADQTLWAHLPHIFAAAIWHMAYHEPTIFNPILEALENNGHCVCSAFDFLSVAINASLLQAEPAVTHQMQMEFLKIVSSHLLRLKALSLTPDKDGLPREIEALYYIIRHFVDRASSVKLDCIPVGHPYAVLRLVLGDCFQSRFTTNEKGRRVLKVAQTSPTRAAVSADEDSTLHLS